MWGSCRVTGKSSLNFLRLCLTSGNVLNATINTYEFFVLAICGAEEKQSFPYHYTYYPKAGINFRLGKIMVVFKFTPFSFCLI